MPSLGRGLILCSEMGTPLDPDNVSHFFLRIYVSSGTRFDIRALRSRWLKARTSTWSRRCSATQAFAITKDVDGHLVDGQNRAAAQLMSTALMKAVGSQEHP